jgi:hypothetical protein
MIYLLFIVYNWPIIMSGPNDFIEIKKIKLIFFNQIEKESFSITFIYINILNIT